MATEEELDTQEPAPGTEAAEPPVDQRPAIDLTDEDDDEPANGAEAKAEASSRRAWRRTMKANLKKAEDAIADRDRRLNELAAEVAGMRGALAARPEPQRQATQQDAPDPVERELESLQSQKFGILAQMNREGLSETQAEKLQKDYAAIERKMIRVAAKAEAPAPQRQRADGEGFTIEQQNAIMEADYPEAFRSVTRQQECRLEYVRLLESGERASYALARRAAKLVHDKYSRKPSPPSDADRARHTSTPGRAGATGGGSSFVPTKAMINSARGYTAHLDDLTDEQRLKIWAKGPGKKLGIGK